MEMGTPGDRGDGQNREAADEVEEHAEVAAVVAVDEHSAEKRHDQAGKRHDNNLPADGQRGMCGGHDVPTHANEVHAGTEERDEHRSEEETERPLRPKQGPVDTVSGGGGHGAW